MSDRAEKCRGKAAECERAALLVTDRTIGAMYADLAHKWRDMAKQAEALEANVLAPICRLIHKDDTA